MQFKYGDDAPITLLTSALEFAKKLMPDPDSFLYTGDHVVHDDLTDFLAETVETNVKTMARYYATEDNETNLDVTALLGNADTRDTLSKSNLDWFNHRGYLTYDLDEKFVVLTLNTVPYSMWEPHYIKTYKAIVSQLQTSSRRSSSRTCTASSSVSLSSPSSGHKKKRRNGARAAVHVGGDLAHLQQQPGVHVWDFDANTYEVLDFTVYSTNISSDSRSWIGDSLQGQHGVRCEFVTHDGVERVCGRIAADSALLEQYYTTRRRSRICSRHAWTWSVSRSGCARRNGTHVEDFEAVCGLEVHAAFVLGAATHYFVSSYLLSDSTSPKASNSSSDNSNEDAAEPRSGASSRSSSARRRTGRARTQSVGCPTKWSCKIAAQCCHATLGAYKRALKRTPDAVRAWEMLGQAKVCLKVDSEEEMLALAEKAAEHGLVNYVVVDAGRTQLRQRARRC
ncbi:Metallo-dependent phosphatase-like [Phytophthora cactorum]|nr:Metallo-dependent phosphatase-like [Phytophthora cactorum]